MTDNDRSTEPEEPGYWIEVHPSGWPHRRIPTSEPVTPGWRVEWVRWDGPGPVPPMPEEEASMTDNDLNTWRDLEKWLRDELQNAKLRAEVLQAMGGPHSPLAPETAQFLREAGDQALAEVEAKRGLLLHISNELADDPTTWERGSVPGEMLRLLAVPHAAHPGYRQEWRP